MASFLPDEVLEAPNRPLLHLKSRETRDRENLPPIQGMISDAQGRMERMRTKDSQEEQGRHFEEFDAEADKIP